MDRDNSPFVGSLKEYVELLIEEFGVVYDKNGKPKEERSMREAARKLGIDWQRLQYWRDKGDKMQEFLDFLNDSSVKLKISKSALIDITTTSKKK